MIAECYDVTRCDIEQSCLLHRLAAAPEVSLSLARDVITKILKHEVDINMVDTSGDTAVVVAARCDNTKMVMELLSRQAALPPDVTHVCSFLQTLTNNWKPQETPYMHALVVKLLWDRLQDTALHSCHKQLHHTLVRLAVTFHTSLVREMFVTEQQVNSVDSEGMAVLHRVAMFDSDDHIRVVLFLIIKGADVNLQNTTGDTPLHVAVKHKNWTMMEVLLHRQAYSNVVNCDQRSVLHIVASHTDPNDFPKLDKILPLLIRNNNDINKEDGEGNTALHLAALAGNMGFVKTLLDNGARADGVDKEQKTVSQRVSDINKKSLTGDAPIHLAAKCNNWGIVRLLLREDLGADYTCRDRNGDTLLHLAARKDHWEIVQHLIQSGLPADTPDSEGFVILHRAAASTRDSMSQYVFQYLLKHDPDLNKRTNSGDTVIHLAAKHERWETVVTLMEHGANPFDCDSEGTSVLDRVVKGSCSPDQESSILKMAIQRNKALVLANNTLVFEAANSGKWDVVQYLVDQGVNIHQLDSQGLSLLHIIAKREQSLCQDQSINKLVKVLLDNGMSMEDRYPNDNTPLKLAAKSNNWGLVEYLLLQGATVQSPDSEGVFVLQRLAMYSEYNDSHRQLLQLLIKAGADVNVRHPSGDSLLHLSARVNNWSFVSHIVQERSNYDLDELDSDGFNILHRLAQFDRGAEWVEKGLIKEFKLDATCGNGDTCLLLAAKQEKWVFITCILKHILNKSSQPCNNDLHRFRLDTSSERIHHTITSLGIQNVQDCLPMLDKRDERGYTVWHYAAMKKQWDIIRELTECGVNTEHVDDEGLNILQKMASDCEYSVRGKECLTTFLKEKGFDFTIKDDFGNTLLQLAAKNNNLQMVTLLLNHVDDVRVKDSDELPVLHRVVPMISKSISSECEKVVTRLIKSGAEVEEPSWDDNTPLHVAGKCNSRSLVSLLLTHGAQAEDTEDSEEEFSQDSEESFSQEYEYEYICLARIVLEKGGKCDILSRRGETICEIAARNENWDIMKCLLTRGTPPLRVHNTSLLHCLAASYDGDNQINVCDLLMEKGLSAETEDHDGNTVLHLAAKAGNWDLVKHLLQKGATCRTLDSNGFSVLHRFVSDMNIYADSRRLDVLDMILSSNVDVNAEDPRGNTAIQTAAKRQLLDIVDRLIDTVENFNTKDSDGFTLLLRLSQTPDNLSLCQHLVQEGADINACSTDGDSVLTLAVKNDNWSVVELLLNKGAHVHVHILQNLYAIHRLIRCRKFTSDFDDLQIMELFINKGVSKDMPDFCRKTPAELALTHKKWKLLTFLLRCGACLNNSPTKRLLVFHELAKCMSASTHSTDITRLLISRGLDINLQNSAGDTPVHVAADNDNYDTVTTFVENGADTNTLDRKGKSLLYKIIHKLIWEPIVTPESGIQFILHWTSELSQPDLAMFYQALFNPNLENLERTELVPKSLVKLIKTLKEFGADFNWRGPENKTVFQMAVDRERWEVVRVLLETGAEYSLSKQEKQSTMNSLHNLKWNDVSENKVKSFIEYITNDLSDTDNSFQDNRRSADLQTVLQKCVECSNWRMATVLVECRGERCGMNTQESLLGKMMSRYSQNEHAEWTSFLDLLISEGLDINSKLQNGSGVLFHDETIKSLTSDEKGFANSLFYALMERGADPLVENSAGQTLLREVVCFGGQRTLNALKKLLPFGVTTHQPRFTEAMLQSQSGSTAQTASPTEKMIEDKNIFVLKMLIESGSSSNAELFRLNTEYQVKLAGQADTDDNIRELLEVLNMAASQPRSLQSLCRLTVSHCLGCGPGRTEKLNSLNIPPVLRDLVLFRDHFTDSLSESNSNSIEPKNISIDGSSSDDGSDELTNSNYCSSESDHSEGNPITALRMLRDLMHIKAKSNMMLL
ncbi:hypothetical protein C0Q70_04759 [Pomacea canaliculata]|uniref:SOCS box domain-containing protein n=1 Tax=Pomacea canaliculata TaxID=400727 RepID=A0A2T7PJ95_POMCA|nr:hypothetical protein C0Q70_04759 [Pomacea canaliculata]